MIDIYERRQVVVVLPLPAEAQSLHGGKMRMDGMSGNISSPALVMVGKIEGFVVAIRVVHIIKLIRQSYKKSFQS